MLDRIRSLTPEPIKRPLRQMRDALDNARRARAFARCVNELRRQARAETVNPLVLFDLRRAWSNDAYSADVSFVCEVAARVLRYPGPFLDCGSGVSTVVAGIIADQQGTRVWSLEQDEGWYQHMSGILKNFAIANVVLWYAPLRRYGDFVWFDVDGRTMPAQFTHVFCDGPAVFATEWPDPLHSNWRVGVVPVLKGRGIRFGEILLDDADDPRCTRVCRQWNELGVETRIVSTKTGAFVLGQPS